MKKVYKLILMSFVAMGALFQSCETTELELIDNPNALTTGDPTFLLNSIQGAYRSSMTIANDRSSELTRIDYMFGRNYFANYGAATMNGLWGNLYSGVIPDIAALEAAETEENDLSHLRGMAKVMQAHMLMHLVDFIGDVVPLAEAGDPTNFPEPNPTTDAGASAYADALDLLDQAVNLLNVGAPTTLAEDFYYGDPLTGEGSDASKWIKLANTLRMRAALTTGDLSTFSSIANGGNIIASEADDLQFNFGTAQTPTDLRHQDYASDYTPSGANIYQSNWLMTLMNENNDPRIRYYFYRQNECTPGASCNPAGNGETLQCSLQTTPVHLQGTPSGDIWCFTENGYWGRLHGNDEGTPPDNFTRTAVGVYPAAGLFDDDAFGSSPRNLTLGAGGAGAGIEPIMLASYVDFMRAEVALTQGNAGSAADFMEDGLEKSMAKVQPFAQLDGSADLSFEPSATDVANYIAGIKADFLAASGDDQWNILAEQYFTTLFGGGADAHNFYRRTGYPTTVSLNIDPAPGNYIRTFLFPSSEVSANPNFSQRTNNDDAVFWNTQPLPSQN